MSLLGLDAYGDEQVLLWWGSMSLVALLNLFLWGYAAWRVRDHVGSPHFRYRVYQALLSGIYVLGTGSRSLVIRADVQRFSMVDTWLANVAVGRSIATVAELSFALQWRLLLGLVGERDRSLPIQLVARWLLPIIVAAEVCSWYAVITTNYLGNAIEESLWTLAVVLVAAALSYTYRDLSPRRQQFIRWLMPASLLYVGFMVSTDVAMYVTRWLEDEATARRYHGLAEGLEDTLRYVVTRRWHDWREEVAWTSLYFTTAVWGSILLIHFPRFGHGRGSSEPSSGE
ncbi:MAG: hypothetical protein B7733_05285 [Myxococcales bacterium FL481]|nr:MAG: hypothetical protein B7733_05285 [Myxococcales bacterium FL481]